MKKTKEGKETMFIIYFTQTIHKVLGHHIYVINILVYGTYEKFQDKNRLDVLKRIHKVVGHHI
jgi:hypothetical protein